MKMQVVTPPLTLRKEPERDTNELPVVLSKSLSYLQENKALIAKHTERWTRLEAAVRRTTDELDMKDAVTGDAEEKFSKRRGCKKKAGRQ
jgi:hypothetical protein